MAETQRHIEHMKLEWTYTGHHHLIMAPFMLRINWLGLSHRKENKWKKRHTSIDCALYFVSFAHLNLCLCCVVRYMCVERRLNRFEWIRLDFLLLILSSFTMISFVLNSKAKLFFVCIQFSSSFSMEYKKTHHNFMCQMWFGWNSQLDSFVRFIS